MLTQDLSNRAQGVGAISDPYSFIYVEGKGFWSCNGHVDVAHPENNYRVARSTDGIYWIAGGPVVMAPDTQNCGIAHGLVGGQDVWVTAGLSGCAVNATSSYCTSQYNNSLAYSVDGQIFIGIGTDVFQKGANAVAFGNRMFVATGGLSFALANAHALPFDGINVARSMDGITWQKGTISNIYVGTAVAYSDSEDIFVVTGFESLVLNPGTNQNCMAVSRDGLIWTAAPLNKPFITNGPVGTGIAFGDGVWVLATFQAAQLAASSHANSTQWVSPSASSVYNIERGSCVAYNSLLKQFIVGNNAFRQDIMANPVRLSNVSIIFASNSAGDPLALKWNSSDFQQKFGIAAVGARSSGTLVPTIGTSLPLSLTGDSVIRGVSAVANTVMQGTLRVEGTLSLDSTSSFVGYNASVYIIGTLSIVPGASFALPGGVALFGSSSILDVKLTIAPAGQSIITVPVMTFGVGSTVFYSFSYVAVRATYDQASCYTLGQPQQVVTTTSLSVTLSITPVPNCVSSTNNTNADASVDRLSPGAIVGITLGVVAVSALVVLAGVLLFRCNQRRRAAKLASKLRENELSSMAKLQLN
jgi:hypothetical protein